MEIKKKKKSNLFPVQLSSLKTETERIQAQRDQLQAELLASRTELDALRVALSHVQHTSKALGNDKVTWGGVGGGTSSKSDWFRWGHVTSPSRLVVLLLEK